MIVTNVTGAQPWTGREFRAVRALHRVRITDLARAAGISRKTAWALERSGAMTSKSAHAYIDALRVALANQP